VLLSGCSIDKKEAAEAASFAQVHHVAAFKVRLATASGAVFWRHFPAMLVLLFGLGLWVDLQYVPMHSHSVVRW
jgi:hypothetical protein